jgi:hypothetical protein
MGLGRVGLIWVVWVKLYLVRKYQVSIGLNFVFVSLTFTFYFQRLK